MAFTLYSLIEAALLFINGIAILNEQRFLSKFTGGGRPTSNQGQMYPGAGGYGDPYDNQVGVKHKALELIRSVKTVLRFPLILLNIITILLLLLFG